MSERIDHVALALRDTQDEADVASKATRFIHDQDAFTQGAEWEKRRLLHRLALLADGFHFAGRLSAEKALRTFIGTEEKS